MKKAGIIAIVLGLFIVSFIVGFYSNLGAEDVLTNYTYVGARGTFDFVKSEQGDHWVTWPVKTLISGNVYSVQDWQTPFPYGPFDLVDIPMNSKYNSPRVYVRASEKVFLTRDVYLDEKYHDANPKGGMVIALISLDRILDKLGLNGTIAAVEENELSMELDLPIVVCEEDATKENVVIWLKEGESTQIYNSEMNRYCIIAEFKEGEDPNKVATKLAYNIIGVM